MSFSFVPLIIQRKILLTTDQQHEGLVVVVWELIVHQLLEVASVHLDKDLALRGWLGPTEGQALGDVAQEVGTVGHARG